MKRFLALICTMCLLLSSMGVFTASAAVATFDNVAAGNQLENGDLSDENKCGNVYFKNTAGISEEAYTGERSLKINRTGCCAGGVPVTLERGKTYIYSCWIKLEDGAQATGQYKTYPDGLPGDVYTTTRVNAYVAPTGTWTNLVEAYTINANAAQESYNMTMGYILNSSVNLLIDDVYFGEVTPAVTVSGAEELNFPGETTYTATVKNQLGGTVGLGSAPITWSLAENYTGVSINASSGKLTVDNTATAGTIKVRATCTPAFNSLSPVVVDKDVILTSTGGGAVTPPVSGDGNLYTNAGFEDGTTGWISGTLASAESKKKSGAKSMFAQFNSTVQMRMYQSVPVTADKVYLFGGYFMADEGFANQTVQVYGEGSYTKYNDSQTSNASLSESEWKAAARTYKATADGMLNVGILAPSTNLFADDMYAGELKVDNIEIAGENSVAIPSGQATETTYTAKVLNQMGNTVGVASETVTWSLADTYTGVSIEAATGKLSVANTATAGTIKVKANCTPSFNGLSEVSFEKEVTLTQSAPTTNTFDCVAPGNQFENGDFEDENKCGSPYFSNGSGTSDVAHSGVRSLIIGGTGKNCAAREVTLEKGKTYIFSAWFKAAGTDTPGVNSYPESVASAPVQASDYTMNRSYVTVSTTEWKQLAQIVKVSATSSVESFKFKLGFLFNTAGSVLVDDIYFGEVTPSFAVSGVNEITIPATSSTETTFTATLTNQLGGTEGMENESIRWSLAEDYTGVTISELNGKLTVDSTATAGTIKVKATCTPTINGLAPIVKEMDVLLKEALVLTPPTDANLYTNAGFEEGTTGWSSGTLSSSTEVKKTGEKALKGEFSGAVQTRMYQDIAVSANKVYVISGHFLALDGSAGSNVQIYGEGPVENYNVGQKVDASLSTSEWKQATRTYKATADGSFRVGVLAPSVNLYADDMYAGELMVADIEITGNAQYPIPYSASSQGTYTAKAINQVGNTVGLQGETMKWSLKAPYAGVSINEDTGVLTVSSTAVRGTVEIVASCTPSFSSQPAFTKTFAIELTKEALSVETVKANMLNNSGFEDGVSGWNGITGVSADYYSGAQSGKASWGSASQKASQVVNLAPNAVYISGVWAKAESESEAGKFLQVYLENKSSNPAITSPSGDGAYTKNITTTTEWQQAVRIYKTDTWTTAGDVSFGLLSERSNMLIDDAYFGRLVIDSFNISGSDTIEIPASAIVKMPYTATLTNQLGNAMGIGTQRVTWELSEDYDGVSIDEVSGQLSVSSTAMSGNLKIKAVCYPSFNTDILPMVYEEKTILLVKPGETSEPQVRKLKITGTVAENSELTASYTFYQKDGNSDASEFQWYKATSLDGTFDPIIGATSNTYTVQVGEADYFYVVEVLPKDNQGNIGASVVRSAVAVKPTAPTAENVTFIGTAYVGSTLTAKYDFVDANGDPEGVSTFRWLRGDAADSLTEISGATSKTYVLTQDDVDKWIAVAVTPVSTVEPVVGVDAEVVGAAKRGPTAATAIDVSIKGKIQAGNTVTASYKYSHPYGLQEKGTKFAWYLDGVLESEKATYAIPSNAGGKTLVLEIKVGCEFAPYYGEAVRTSGATVSKKDVSWGGGGGTSFKGGGISNNDTPIVTPPTPVETSKFADVTTHWAKDAIEEMADKGIVNGVGDQKFEPDRSVSRSEFVAMIVRLLGIDDAGDEQIFADVTSADWYYSVVQTASRAGLISGRGDGFDPIATISREEAAVVLIKAYEKYKGEATAEPLGFTDKDSISSWATAAVEKAVGVGLLKGDDTNTVRPAGVLTRAEAASILARLDVAFNGGAE